MDKVTVFLDLACCVLCTITAIVDYKTSIYSSIGFACAAILWFIILLIEINNDKKRED